MPQFAAYPDFASASRSVLEHLRQSIGFDLWMVTRTEGENWIVLEAEDHGYGVESGNVFRWADSFCSRMVRGEGPCIAPNSELVAAYNEAPIGRQVPIGAYIGIPIEDSDGGLFGTLCAIDPKPKSESLQAEFPRLQIIGRMLGSILMFEMKLAAEDRTLKIRELQTLVDPETNALTDAAWERLVHAEEKRCISYGHSAHVVSVRLPESSSDEEIKNTAAVLSELISGDVCLGRISRTEFMILSPEIGHAEGEEFYANVAERLASAKLVASLGHAMRDPRRGLLMAIQELKLPQVLEAMASK